MRASSTFRRILWTVVWVAAALLAGCGSGQRPTPPKATPPAPPPPLIAEPESADVGSATLAPAETPPAPARSEAPGAAEAPATRPVQRYIVRNLPPRHEFQLGQIQALFAPASGTQSKALVGYGYVTELQGEQRSLVLTAGWVSEAYYDQVLELGNIPSGHHLGKQLGEVTAKDLHVQINMGAEQGVEVGDIYRVLAHGQDLGSRSPGPVCIGLVQVIAVSPTSAETRIEQGFATVGAFAEYAGRNANLPQNKPLRILVVSFSGDDKRDPFAAKLREALEEEVQAQDAAQTANLQRHTILPPARGDSVSSPADAVKLGKKLRADLVIWGSLDPAGEQLVVTTHATFMDKGMQEALRREWDVSTALDQVLINSAEDALMRARILAQYLVGLSDYADWSDRLTGDWPRAAYFWEQVRAHGSPDEQQSARVVLFYYHEEMQEWARAAVMADEIAQHGAQANNLSHHAHGLYMQALLAEHNRARKKAEDLVGRAASLLMAIADERRVIVTRGKVADLHAQASELDKALEIHLKEELPAYEKLDDLRGRAITLSKIANIHAMREQLTKALRIYEKDVLPAFTRLGDRRRKVMAQGTMGIFYLQRNQRGDRAKAKKLFTEAIRGAEAIQLTELASGYRALMQHHAL